MSTEIELINIAKRIKALAQNGLVFSLSEYDTERYQELSELSDKITSLLTDCTPIQIQESYLPAKEYVTPKVDIRAVVFNDNNEILMVREKADGLWSLPGGWADIGFTPKEVAEKEVKEETGLNVKAEKLLAVLDMRNHNHPPSPYYVYKVFISCKLIDGEFNSVFDILDKGFFKQNEIPPLSSSRILKPQLDLMFEFHNNPDKPAVTD